MEGRIRLAIADNDAITLAALRDILGRGHKALDVTWTATHGEDAVARCLDATQRPALLLLDMSMGEMSGPSICREIRRHGALPRILAITSFEPGVYAAKAARAGAQGLVVKDSPALIRRAIGVVLTGGTFNACSPSVSFEDSEAAFRRLRKTPAEGVGRLSDQERSVMDLCMQGLTLEEIAGRLGVAASTVRTHVRRVKEKLGAKTLAQAVMMVMEHRYE